jgi:hypothetical protein
MEIVPDKLDDLTYAIYLEVPGSKVVLLQGLFETYEGVGTVRTIDIRRSLICILTTPEMFLDCASILKNICDKVPWRSAANLKDSEKERFLGYFKEGRYAKNHP